MTARILAAKPIADAIKAETAAEIADIRRKHGFSPCLVVVRVGEDPASAVYVNAKVRTAAELGIVSEHLHLDADIGQAELTAIVSELNDRTDVDGILVQLPLPRHINEREVLELIDPERDVDGFHPINAGRLMQGHASLEPCTPAGVIEVLRRSGIGMVGANTVIVGRSNIVGKPLAMMLLRENATVTICHSQTRDLADVTRRANILIAAIGQPGFICGTHIGGGATVVDVGINNVTDRSLVSEFFDGEDLEKRLAAIEKRGFTLVGDVNPREAIAKAGAYTPVPGGIGLLTVAMLMKNAVTAAKMRRGI